MIGFISISILIFIITRIGNFFFLQSYNRYLLIIGSILVAIFCSNFSWIFLKNHPIKQGNFQNKSFAKYLFFFSNIIIALIILPIIPKPKIPTNHELIITVLPSDKVDLSNVQITGLRKILDAPERGSAYVDLETLSSESGIFSYSEEGLLLSQNAIVHYDAFFSGCISIFFNTSPESHLVKIQFDQIEEIFSLLSKEKTETEVNLCAPISIQQMSLKWKLLITGMYIADFTSVFAILFFFEFALFFLFLSKSKSSEIFVRYILLIIFFIVTISSITSQIIRIYQFPKANNNYAPPLKPSVFIEEFNFGSIYQDSYHTKKFAHAFIMNFLDLYPQNVSVYISRATLDEFGFNSFEFDRWFKVYNPQPLENSPIEISNNEIKFVIESENWEITKFSLPERGKEFSINYHEQEPEEFVLITHAGYEFYVIPDGLLN